MPPRRRSPLPPQSANALTQSILTYLKSRRYMAWRNATGGFYGKYRFGEKGSADVFAIKDGRFHAIEVKVGDDKLSEDQLRWLDDARRHGAVVIVATCLDDVTEVCK